MSRPSITSIRHERSEPRSLTTILRSFHVPDEVREFTKGRVEVMTIAGRTLARATYDPGWKWSEHVGPIVGARRCTSEHLGVVLSGHATVAFDDGRVYDLLAGTVFIYRPSRMTAG